MNKFILLGVLSFLISFREVEGCWNHCLKYNYHKRECDGCKNGWWGNICDNVCSVGVIDIIVVKLMVPV